MNLHRLSQGVLLKTRSTNLTSEPSVHITSHSVTVKDRDTTNIGDRYGSIIWLGYYPPDVRFYRLLKRASRGRGTWDDINYNSEYHPWFRRRSNEPSSDG